MNLCSDLYLVTPLLTPSTFWICLYGHVIFPSSRISDSTKVVACPSLCCCDFFLSWASSITPPLFLLPGHKDRPLLILCWSSHLCLAGRLLQAAWSLMEMSWWQWMVKTWNSRLWRKSTIWSGKCLQGVSCLGRSGRRRMAAAGSMSCTVLYLCCSCKTYIWKKLHPACVNTGARREP